MRGKEIARERQAAAINFYQSVLQEVRAVYRGGQEILSELLEMEE